MKWGMMIADDLLEFVNGESPTGLVRMRGLARPEVLCRVSFLFLERESLRPSTCDRRFVIRAH